MGKSFALVRGSMLKNDIFRPGDVVEIGNADPSRIGVVVSEVRKMFMAGETVLVLTDGRVERYLKDKLKKVISHE